MNFQVARMYEDELSYSFDRLSQKTITARMQDGRVASFLLFDWLQRRFANLTPITDPQWPLCLTDGTHLFQVRTVNNQCLTNPHVNNGGGGREYDQVAHATALRRITHFILIDLEYMPTITYAAIPRCYFYHRNGKPKRRLTAEEAKAMIQHARTLGDSQ